jgi:tetratricopeptide (TPR) repeat protein
MTCTEVQERDIAEAYLLGRLDAAERDAFEQHYFECARCYSNLQAVRSVREALASLRAPVRRHIPWPWLAVAATMLVSAGAGIAWHLQTRAGLQPAPAGTIAGSSSTPRLDTQLARLADVTPPPYEPRRLRGAGEREAFIAGMRQYTRRDYAAAIPLLERALKDDPGAEDARFYLGAALLLHDRPADAVAALRPLAVKPDSPYAEEAQFLIAKAHIRSGELEAAATALEKTAQMHGEREAEASSLRARLAQLQVERTK